MKILIVCNPTAGHGRGAREISEIQTLCHGLGLGLETDVRTTASRGHATEIVAAANLHDYDAVVAAGGDGTVFETVTGLFRNPAGAAVPLGVMPLGTGNSFARDLGLDRKRLAEAASVIAAGATRKVDVARVRLAAEEFHYLNILGVGFPCDVAVVAERLKVLGSSAYTVGVVLRTAFLKTFNLRLELDGLALEREATFVEISNSRYTADFLMAPEARVDDGVLDVTVLGRISRRRLLQLFPTVFRGEHIHYQEVETFRARRITVSTDRPMVLSPDGELVGTTPVEISCRHRALEVFAPQLRPMSVPP